MSFRAELVLQRDDGTLVFLPRPPASTSGQDYALVSTDGVLHWVAVAAGTGSSDDILTEDGNVLVDDVTGNVMTDS